MLELREYLGTAPRCRVWILCGARNWAWWSLWVPANLGCSVILCLPQFTFWLSVILGRLSFPERSHHQMWLPDCAPFVRVPLGFCWLEFKRKEQRASALAVILPKGRFICQAKMTSAIWKWLHTENKPVPPTQSALSLVGIHQRCTQLPRKEGTDISTCSFTTPQHKALFWSMSY